MPDAMSPVTTTEMLADGYHAVPRGKLAAVVTTLEMHAPPPSRPTRGGIATSTFASAAIISGRRD
ncbi:MAG: hypothetical protein NVS2B3_01940 [Vulcanimicrobiaceae bacterium]